MDHECLKLNLDRFVSKSKASELSGVSLYVLNGWIKSNLVRTVVFGRRALVDMVDLNRFIREVFLEPAVSSRMPECIEA